MAKVRDAQAGDQYVDKLGKILPAELTATYFLIRTLAGNNPSLTIYLILLAAVLCVAFYVVAPKMISMRLPLNRALYCLTFLLWVSAIDPARIGTDVLFLSPQNLSVFVFLTSGMAAIWSFVVPHLMQEEVS